MAVIDNLNGTLASSGPKYFPIAVLVVSLIWSVGIVAQEPSKPSPERKQEQTKKDQQQSAAFPTIPVRIVANDASITEKREQSTEYYEQHDLEAQLRMAGATEAGAKFTLWLLVATVAEFAALVWVLALNIQANKTSRNAVVEAQAANALAAQANKTSRDALEIEKRAWMHMAGGEFHKMFNDRKGIDHWLFKAKWKNAGSTPARGVKASIMMGRKEPNEQVPIFRPRPSKGGPAIVGKGGTVFTAQVAIPAETLRALTRNECRLFIHSIVNYNDIFSDVVRQSEWCSELILTIGADDIGDEKKTKHGYLMPIVGDQNTVT